MILNLSVLLRASLKDNKEFMCVLKDEITLCEKYLEIEKIRMGERLGIVWDVEDSLLNYYVPKLSIQPLVENSILHGIQHLESGGTITIKIKSVSHDKIGITISNPTSPRIEKNSEDHNNIGMKNLQERLNICFDGEVIFAILEENNLYKVDINIPKKTNINN